MPERFSIDVEGEKIVGIHHEPSTTGTTKARPKKGKSPCIISCHGLLATKDSPKYVLLANGLSNVGFASIRFDFRGCGESGGSLQNSHISNRLKDLQTVIQYVEHNLGYNSLGLFGSSLGGFLAYIVASSEPKINAMVTLASPYSMLELFDPRVFNEEYYAIDGIEFGKNFINDVKKNGDLTPGLLGKIKCPIYIFHGDFDGLVPVSHARRLYDNLRAVKELRIINGGDHMFSHPFHLAEILKTSIEWYKKYLGSA